jgi:hypothetical protein
VKFGFIAVHAVKHLYRCLIAFGFALAACDGATSPLPGTGTDAGRPDVDAHQPMSQPDGLVVASGLCDRVEGPRGNPSGLLAPGLGVLTLPVFNHPANDLSGAKFRAIVEGRNDRPELRTDAVLLPDSDAEPPLLHEMTFEIANDSREATGPVWLRLEMGASSFQDGGHYVSLGSARVSGVARNSHRQARIFFRPRRLADSSPPRIFRVSVCPEPSAHPNRGWQRKTLHGHVSYHELVSENGRDFPRLRLSSRIHNPYDFETWNNLHIPLPREGVDRTDSIWVLPPDGHYRTRLTVPRREALFVRAYFAGADAWASTRSSMVEIDDEN